MHLLAPEIEAEVVQKQVIQKSAYDRRARAREFHIGQEVMCKNLRPGPKYILNVIVERQGPNLLDRHMNHLKELYCPVNEDRCQKSAVFEDHPPTDQNDYYLMPDTMQGEST